jgi:hypothetical protein
MKDNLIFRAGMLVFLAATISCSNKKDNGPIDTAGVPRLDAAHSTAQCNTIVECKSQLDAIRTQMIDLWNSAEEKVTRTGVVFKRDRSNPKLGLAYKAPNGVIWGSVVLDNNGKPLVLSWSEADILCKDFGARLPSTNDYSQLSLYMGADDHGIDPFIELYSYEDRVSLNPIKVLIAAEFFGGLLNEQWVVAGEQFNSGVKILWNQYNEYARRYIFTQIDWAHYKPETRCVSGP